MRALAGPAAALLAAAGCAGSPPLSDGLPAAAARSIELAATPFFPQQEYRCGPAALATVLVASGVAVAPEALAPQVYLPGRQGSLQAELLAAARRHGRLAYVLAEDGQALVAELAEGRPVLVLLNLGLSRLPRWHYAVLIGYDADENVALLRSGRTQRLGMRWQRFAGAWHRGGRWAVTTLPPQAVPAHAEPARYLEAAAGLEAAGRRQEAAEAYDTAIARWPAEPHAWLGRGNVAYAEDDLEAAVDAYLRAILIAPRDPAARNNLAQALADAGCREEAIRQAALAAALAAGTPLEATVAATAAAIEAAVPAGCRLPDRAWPD